MNSSPQNFKFLNINPNFTFMLFQSCMTLVEHKRSNFEECSIKNKNRNKYQKIVFTTTV